MQPPEARDIYSQSWTALFRAFSSHQQFSAYSKQSIFQPRLRQTGQTLMACTVAGGYQGIFDFSHVVLLKRTFKKNDLLLD